MEKTKNVICPNCGKIQELKEIDYTLDYIGGHVKDCHVILKDKCITGIRYCAICR